MEPSSNNPPRFIPKPPPPILKPAAAATGQTYEEAKLIQKLAATTFKDAALAQPVNWANPRIHTAGDTVVVKDLQSNKTFVTKSGTQALTIYSFNQGLSQGLVDVAGRTAAATVTTHIRNPIPRDEQQYRTYVQFEKYTIDNTNKDFSAPETRAATNLIFYSGCHLIDYQYIAGDAHTNPGNYFPGNYFYNMSIRNWLVNPDRTSAFVEIPVYTPNPPLIVAKRGHGDYPIPVAIFFIQIGHIQGGEKPTVTIYCFPNNGYDFENTKEYLAVTNPFAEKMAPHFQLNPALYPLLKPAIIHTVHSKQMEKEKGMAELMQDLFGQTENNAVIATLAQQVLFDEVESTLLLPASAPVQDKFFDEALDFAGKFLLQHGVNNVLKAETLSLTARLAFIDSIIDHIEEFETASIAEARFFTTLQIQMQDVLTEFTGLAPTLQVDELLQLSSTQLSLTSYFTLPMALQDNNSIFDEEQFRLNFARAIKSLNLLVSKHPTSFSVKQKILFLEGLYAAEHTLNSLAELGIVEGFKRANEFLYNCRGLCQAIFAEMDREARASLSPKLTEQFFQGLGSEPKKRGP